MHRVFLQSCSPAIPQAPDWALPFLCTPPDTLQLRAFSAIHSPTPFPLLVPGVYQPSALPLPQWAPARPRV